MSLIEPLASAWRTRDVAGRALMTLFAVAALAAAALAFPTGAERADAHAWITLWRAWGLLVFAGLFALLALRPRRSAGVWELACLHKAAMAVSVGLLPEPEPVIAEAVVDAVLALGIATAYGLCRGWHAWHTAHGS